MIQFSELLSLLLMAISNKSSRELWQPKLRGGKGTERAGRRLSLPLLPSVSRPIVPIERREDPGRMETKKGEKKKFFFFSLRASAVRRYYRTPVKRNKKENIFSPIRVVRVSLQPE